MFAGLRERAGADEVALELPEGASVADALAQLEHLTGGLPVVMASTRSTPTRPTGCAPATSWR